MFYLICTLPDNVQEKLINYIEFKEQSGFVFKDFQGWYLFSVK